MFISKLVAPIVTLILCLGEGSIVEAGLSASAFAAYQFDYIIVGGGTAGLVVANRLSANPHIKVGVLEAGANAIDEEVIYMPGKVGWAVGGQYDWNFETVEQTVLNNRKLGWSRGKALGGSSAINFFVWMRGNKPDYDAWAALGNSGWDFNSMVPYFKKPETFHEPTPLDASTFKLDYVTADHGDSGPINTCYSNTYGGSHQYWHDTLNSLGVPARDTFNGSNWGVWTGLTSVNPGNPGNRTRSYSASQYWAPYANRPNFHVLTGAMVRKVVIQSVGGHQTATGVVFTHGGVDYTVNAASEVILSAGTVQSPQILELSGVGNPTVLNASNIPLKVNSPKVGENLQDRIMTVMLYEIDPSVENQDVLQSDDEDVIEEIRDQYFHNQTGPLTVLPTDFAYVPLHYFMNSSYVTYLRGLVTGTDDRTNNIKSKLEWAPNHGSMEFVFDPNQLFPMVTPEPGKKYGTVFQMLQYPFSTGSIHIPPAVGGVSPTSDIHPIIDPKYYEGDGVVDMLTMAEGQKFADSLARTSPLSSIIVKRLVPPEPAPGTETDWLQYVKDTTVSDWHPIGTCAMGGTGGISKGVVDEKLKVYGVKGLRVVDASIIPIQISSHLQGTVYAIAEKGAHMILQDFECKRRRRRGRKCRHH
ncbi:hypothetical protein TWF481_003129 [Arthrobotrys musiformis]|uniref:Glucose-methanol-choline oxidoreductase N-terminal domain-containing protein n=1 Tax=Arthrobotrys musiformis TaxID=47236 RepID=A0AAV9VRC0_9PEZI